MPPNPELQAAIKQQFATTSRAEWGNLQARMLAPLRPGSEGYNTTVEGINRAVPEVEREQAARPITPPISHGGIITPQGEFIPEGGNAPEGPIYGRITTNPGGVGTTLVKTTAPVRRDWNGNIVYSQAQIDEINASKQEVFNRGLLGDYVATDAGYKQGQFIGTRGGRAQFYAGTNQPLFGPPGPYIPTQGGVLGLPSERAQIETAIANYAAGKPTLFGGRKSEPIEISPGLSRQSIKILPSFMGGGNLTLVKNPKGGAYAIGTERIAELRSFSSLTAPLSLGKGEVEDILKQTPAGFAPMSSKGGGVVFVGSSKLEDYDKTPFGQFYAGLKPQEPVGFGLSNTYANFTSGLNEWGPIKGLSYAQGPMPDTFKWFGSAAEGVGGSLVGLADIGAEATFKMNPGRAAGLFGAGALIYGGGIAYKTVNRDFSGALKDVSVGLAIPVIFKGVGVGLRNANLEFRAGRALYGKEYGNFPQNVILSRAVAVETLGNEVKVPGGTNSLLGVQVRAPMELRSFNLFESLKRGQPAYVSTGRSVGFAKGEMAVYEPEPLPKGISFLGPRAPPQAVSYVSGLTVFEGKNAGVVPFRAAGYQVLSDFMPGAKTRAFAVRSFSELYAKQASRSEVITLEKLSGNPQAYGVSTSFGVLKFAKRNFKANPLTGEPLPKGAETSFAQALSAGRTTARARGGYSFSGSDFSRLDIYFIGRKAASASLGGRTLKPGGEGITFESIAARGPKTPFSQTLQLAEAARATPKALELRPLSLEVGKFEARAPGTSPALALTSLATKTRSSSASSQTFRSSNLLNYRSSVGSRSIWGSSSGLRVGSLSGLRAASQTRTGELMRSNSQTRTSEIMRSLDLVRSAQVFRTANITRTATLTRSIIIPRMITPITPGIIIPRVPPFIPPESKGGLRAFGLQRIKGRKARGRRPGSILTPFADPFSKFLTESKTLKPAKSPSEKTSRKYFYSSFGLRVPTAEMLTKRAARRGKKN